MRLFAIDFGSKRIGLAVGETEIGIASPRHSVTPTGTLRLDAEMLAPLIRDEQADRVIVGLPIMPDGTEGKMARICRMLGSELEKLGFEVQYQDESLSSIAAEGHLREHEFTAAQRKKRLDSEAACVILERVFATGGANA